MEKWHRLKYQPVLPLGENGEMVTGSAEHIALSRRGGYGFAEKPAFRIAAAS